jgi:hypothetical protein
MLEFLAPRSSNTHGILGKYVRQQNADFTRACFFSAMKNHGTRCAQVEAFARSRSAPSNWERDTMDARRRRTMLWSIAARRRQRRRKRQQSTGDDSDTRSTGARSMQRIVSKCAAPTLILVHRKFEASLLQR